MTVELLARGRVPAEPILTILRAHVRKADGDRMDNETTELRWVAARSGVPYDTLATYLGQGRIQSLSFDTADELLAAMDKCEYWRGPDLFDIYYGVDLNWVKCQCPGCETMIHQEGYLPPVCVIDGCASIPKARGLCNAHYIAAGRDGVLESYPASYTQKPRSVYCSRSCSQAAYQQRKGITTSRRKSYLQNRTEKCRNGHKRTEANTKVRQNGHIECRDCIRESRQARRKAA